MTLGEILAPERVRAELSAGTKEEAVAELAELLGRGVAVAPAAEIARVLLERERLSSTAIGEGIAIPHGRLAGIDAVVAAFGRSSRGIDFDSVDGRPTHLFFALVAPEDAAALHLKALARISRRLKSAEFRERLLRLSGEEEIYQAILAEDARD